MSARCSRRYCGAFLEIGTDGNGRLVARCSLCALNKRGLCRDCQKPLGVKNRRASMRCRSCARLHRCKLARPRDRDRYVVRLPRTLELQATPERRERKRLYMAAYRAREGRDDQSRAYQRAYMALRRADAGYRAKQNARKRELRAQRRAA